MIRKCACLAAALIFLFAGNGFRPAHASAPEGGETAPRQIVHGPLVPPDNRDYDEWKGIVFSPETVFDVEVNWHLYSKGQAALTEKQIQAGGYRMEPAAPVSRFEIVSAEAEPVGGEMKLRSGGYVSITITGLASTDFQYSLNSAASGSVSSSSFYTGSADIVYGFTYSSPGMYPFDCHTGVSFLHYFEDPDADYISPFEATDTGFVESRVTWKGRNYRILAREDHRNLGSENWKREKADDRIVVRIERVKTEVIYSFRVPADYDGLALCIPKSRLTGGGKSKTGQGSAEPPVRELYADILTGSDGRELDLNDYYFVRVSDLLEHFKSQPKE